MHIVLDFIVYIRVFPIIMSLIFLNVNNIHFSKKFMSTRLYISSFLLFQVKHDIY